jgi:hypothetical protein
MKQNILVLTVLMVFLVSCKNDGSKETENQKSAPAITINPNTFKIEVEGTWKEDDELIIFWKDASIAYFDDDHTIYQGIKGSGIPQKIIFELEEGFIPNDIRFDVSSNKNQKEIVLNYIKMEQQDRKFLISKDNLADYFTPNKFITFDKSTGVIATKEIEGAYDPILFTTTKIYVEMEKVLMTSF